MSYVPSFEYDIFISFTHADNDRLPGKKFGWVDEFHYQLESWLARRRGLEGLRIWRDRELQGNTQFNVAIENRLDSTALFFVLHSRAYRKSDYCRKELDWFHHKYRDSLLVGENKRIFNILLNNYPPDDWHPVLGNAIGFPMHDAEGDELGDFILPTDPEYPKRLRPIVDAAETTLEAMRAQQATATPAPAIPGSSAEDPLPRIFLATVADDQDDLRERLFNEIGHRAQVLEEIPPTLAYEAHTQAVATALGSADLSVHVLGASPGRKIKDCRETSYPREQAEIALTQPVHQILWLPEDLSLGDVQDPAYRDWLQALETGEREQAELELVRCGTPDLIALTLDRIEEIRKGSGPDGELSFLIDTHQKDQRYAFRLGDLLAAQGADVDFNQESRDPVRSLAYFEHSVRQAQNLVILFGRVVAPWLQDRVQTAVKVLGEQFTAGEHETFQHL